MDLTISHFPEDSETMGTSDHRRICSSSQPSTTSLLEPQTRSSSRSAGCLQTVVAINRTISTLTVEIDPASPPKDKEAQSLTSGTGNSLLVPDGALDDEREANVVSDYQDMDLSRMAIITQYMHQQAIPSQTISVLQQKHRLETIRNYNQNWRKWVLWCQQQQQPSLDPLNYNSKNVLTYLTSLPHYSTSHLNVIESSISLVYPNKPNISRHHLIKDFFTGHKKGKIVVPNKEDIEIWDLNILPKYIATKYQQSNNLSIKDLQQKNNFYY
ncbi:MAG: hypothetical protein EXX96DRAFT_165302 [Benjaminiella poitrasii]|nr:MAG: hypothetical protein EXX96DRAFT_165302 [Benjaminiella poitrasii]